MKTTKLFFLAISTCLMAACSGDDDAGDNNHNDVAGVYSLTSVMITNEVDFNQDEIASFDLMDESPCYANSTITLNEDHTYMAIYNSVLHESETGCFSEESEGTWSVEGDDLTLTNTMIEPNAEIEYDIEDDILIYTRANAAYPDRDEEGNPIYSTGAVTLTYTKIE